MVSERKHVRRKGHRAVCSCLAYVDLRGFPDVLSAGNYASLLKTGLQVSAWCTSPNANMFVAKVIAPMYAPATSERSCPVQGGEI